MTASTNIMCLMSTKIPMRPSVRYLRASSSSSGWSVDAISLDSACKAVLLQVQYALLVSSIVATAANCAAIGCAYKLMRKSGDTMHVFVISTALADLAATGKLV